MRTDWIIQGGGLATIVNDGISNRLQCSNSTFLLWNGNNQLVNSEIIADVKFTSYTTLASRGWLLLRSDLSGSNCYCVVLDAPNIYYLYRVISGVATLLTTFRSTLDYSAFRTIRFRIDGQQLTVHEYINGSYIQAILIVDTNTSIVSGRAGFGGNSGNNITILFDNININQRP